MFFLFYLKETLGYVKISVQIIFCEEKWIPQSTPSIIMPLVMLQQEIFAAVQCAGKNYFNRRSRSFPLQPSGSRNTTPQKSSPLALPSACKATQREQHLLNTNLRSQVLIRLFPLQHPGKSSKNLQKCFLKGFFLYKLYKQLLVGERLFVL